MRIRRRALRRHLATLDGLRGRAVADSLYNLHYIILYYNLYSDRRRVFRNLAALDGLRGHVVRREPGVWVVRLEHLGTVKRSSGMIIHGYIV